MVQMSLSQDCAPRHLAPAEDKLDTDKGMAVKGMVMSPLFHPEDLSPF